MIEKEIVAIIAILSTFGAGAVVIIVLIVFKFRQRELQSQEIRAAIEKGIEVPFPPPKVQNYRTKGLVWTSLGVALVIALAVAVKVTVAVWGLLPLAVGVAYLLIDKGEKKEEAGSETG